MQIVQHWYSDAEEEEDDEPDWGFDEPSGVEGGHGVGGGPGPAGGANPPTLAPHRKYYCSIFGTYMVFLCRRCRGR